MEGKQKVKEKKKQGWDDDEEDEDVDVDVDLDLEEQSSADESDLKQKQRHQPPNISPLIPIQREAYGGGLYGKDDDQTKKQPSGKPKASDTQSADGPVDIDAATLHHHKPPPPSSGDRDIDITGQSYIQ